jgi:hypothetical protein
MVLGCTSVFTATQEADVSGTDIQGQLWQVSRRPYLKIKIRIKRLGVGT